MQFSSALVALTLGFVVASLCSECTAGMESLWKTAKQKMVTHTAVQVVTERLVACCLTIPVSQPLEFERTREGPIFVY